MRTCSHTFLKKDCDLPQSSSLSYKLLELGNLIPEYPVFTGF